MSHSKEEYEFRKQLKFLKGLHGQGTEMISIYVPQGYNINMVTNKLREEASQAMNIKSKTTRKNVTAAIESLLGALKNIKKTPEKGIAVFCGNIAGRSGESNIKLFTIEPLMDIPIQTYRCDSAFFLEPLEAMLEAKDVYGLVTVDRREATLAYLKGKKIDIIRTMASQVPGKHRAGGQSSQRFERLIEIAAHDWFKKVGESIDDAFADDKIKGVIVGGPGPTKQEFLNGGYIGAKVAGKIIGTVDTSYTDDYGIQEIMEKSGDILKELDIIKEKALVNRFLKEASTGNLATYGEAEVREALTLGKVDTLLLSEALAWRIYTLKCPQCGETTESTAMGNCPKCNTKLRVEREVDLVEDLAEKAAACGAEIEVISTDTPEGQQFLTGFGGIGAILRYK